MNDLNNIKKEIRILENKNYESWDDFVSSQQKIKKLKNTNSALKDKLIELSLDSLFQASQVNSFNKYTRND